MYLRVLAGALLSQIILELCLPAGAEGCGSRASPTHHPQSVALAEQRRVRTPVDRPLARSATFYPRSNGLREVRESYNP